jgi:hypothetical protein
MQVTIQLPDDLRQHLLDRATQLNVSLETLILQSLRQFSQSSPNESVSQWSEAVLSYKGIADFPAFESYRDDLLPPPEPELF